MKLRHIGVLLLLIGLVLTGCYVAPGDGEGSIGVQLPDDDPDGSTQDPDLEGQTARIYLLQGDTLVDLTENVFVDIDLVEGNRAVTVGPVPAGNGYQVILLLGETDEEVFYPARFAVSEVFTVISGESNEITPLVTEPNDMLAVAPDLIGEDLVGITATPDGVFTATTDTLFVGDANLNFDDGSDVAGDQLVNSLSVGWFFDGSAFAQEPWLNTTEGILPYRGAAFDADFSANLAQTSVLSSGSFGIGLGADRNLYAFFQIDGGLGGLWVTNDNRGTPAAWEWLDEVDLSDLVTGQPVHDFVVDFDNEAVYFATKLGAFRLTTEVLTEGDSATVQDVLDEADFFVVTVDGTEVDVTDLALVGDSLYLATGKGVIKGTVVAGDEVVDVGDGEAVIPATANREVLAMAFGGGYGAILTNNFIIVTDNQADYKLIPIYAGTGGTPSDIFLDSINGIVLVSGSNGLLAVDIDEAMN